MIMSMQVLERRCFVSSTVPIHQPFVDHQTMLLTDLSDTVVAMGCHAQLGVISCAGSLDSVGYIF